MHVQLQEAEKRLAAAKDAYGHAVAALDRQYCKPLVAGGNVDDLQAINELRRSYLDVGDVIGATAMAALACEQPPSGAPVGNTVDGNAPNGTPADAGTE